MKKIDVKNPPKVLAPEGLHAARLIQIIRLGVQRSEKFNSETDQVLLGFELVDEKHVFNEERGEQPFVMSRTYSLGLGKKSNLRKIVENMIGKQLKENSTFDIETLAGEPCQIQVKHTENDKGDKFANIDSVVGPPKVKGKTVKVTRAENDIIVFDIDDFTKEQFDALADWIKTNIKKSKQWPDVKHMAEGKAAPKAAGKKK